MNKKVAGGGKGQVTSKKDKNMPPPQKIQQTAKEIKQKKKNALKISYPGKRSLPYGSGRSMRAKSREPRFAKRNPLRVRKKGKKVD